MSGEEKRRPAHCGKRAKDKAEREIGAEEDNQQFLLGACEEDSDRARDQFHEKLNKPHDEGREDKEPGALLEGLPTEAKRGTDGESHRRQDSTQAKLGDKPQ